MQQFRVMGAPDALGYKPELVASQAVSETEKLLDIMVETNPADKECDSRIRVTSRSLQAVYNAVSTRALYLLLLAHVTCLMGALWCRCLTVYW